MGGGNHHAGIKLTGDIGKSRRGCYAGIAAPGTGRQQAGDNGMFHSISGGPGIRADYDIIMILTYRQPHPEGYVEQVFIENGTYAGRAKKLHLTLILLLWGQMSTKKTLMLPKLIIKNNYGNSGI
jgi:hypothetical protein